MLCKQGYCSYEWRSDLSHHQDIPKVWVSFEANSCHANWQILLVTQRMNERKQRKEKGKTAIREINKACGSFYVDTYCILCVCVCVCVRAYTSHSPKTTIMNGVYTSVTSAVQSGRGVKPDQYYTMTFLLNVYSDVRKHRPAMKYQFHRRWESQDARSNPRGSDVNTVGFRIITSLCVYFITSWTLSFCKKASLSHSIERRL